MTREEVLARLDPPDRRGPPDGSVMLDHDPAITERWSYVTRTSTCWKAGWWACFCSVILTIPALPFAFDYASNWFLDIGFGADGRVKRKVAWTHSQL